MHNFVLWRGSGDRMASIWFRWLPSNHHTLTICFVKWMHQDIVRVFWVLNVTIMLHNMCNASYSLKKGKDDVSIRSLRVKRLSCPWLDLGCHGRALDRSERERLKTCRDFVATSAFANYKLVILSLSTWCLGVDGLTQRNPARCFLNSQALHSWRQQWLTSDLLKRLLCRVLATTIQDERKESTNGVATRPAAWEGELLAVRRLSEEPWSGNRGIASIWLSRDGFRSTLTRIPHVSRIRLDLSLCI